MTDVKCEMALETAYLDDDSKPIDLVCLRPAIGFITENDVFVCTVCARQMEAEGFKVTRIAP